ncbi:MAG: helix-turn-helix domain-containing protein [Bacteroidetes bacterium]|nr:helix-turn-helix domain-containing protein [Bacteroidota bacterium]MDA1122350.1 helix-turn-helix domain-containing protein [Bacteroidota bacterium]
MDHLQNMETGNFVLIPRSDLMNLFGEALERNNELLRESILKDLQNKPKNHTRKRTCELLGVSHVTLWKLDKKDELKPIRIGSKVLYRDADIQAYLNKCEVSRGLHNKAI